MSFQPPCDLTDFQGPGALMDAVNAFINECRGPAPMQAIDETPMLPAQLASLSAERGSDMGLNV